MASQAKQVFYVNDQIQTKWFIVCHMPTRSNLNQINKDEVNNVTEYPPFTREFLSNDLLRSANGDRAIYARNSKEGIWVTN